MAQQSRGYSLKFLALGDSYTIGESVPEYERWPVQLSRAVRRHGVDLGTPTIIATTGWRTDQLKDAILRERLEPPYDVVSLLIGVNNQYQGKSSSAYAREFEELLILAIKLAGEKKENVFVVSIPDYGFTPFGREQQPGISKDIDRFNELNRNIASRYEVAYFDITPISRKGLTHPDLVAGDGLHPSGKMYAEWIETIVPALLGRK